MLTFLRRIRRSLIDSGATRKYLIYAIGEIALVVIGILIALQINNWNEGRKTQIQRLNLMLSIQNSLSKSSDNLNFIISKNNITIASYETVLGYMESNNPYNDTLGHHLALFTDWSSPFLDISAYETLKTKGSEFIKNDSLRISIIQVFEQDFETYVNEYDRSEWETSRSVVRPFFVKHFRTVSHDPRIVEPNDYEKLRTNEEFKNILTYLINRRYNGVRQGEKLLDKIEQVISAISAELN